MPSVSDRAVPLQRVRDIGVDQMFILKDIGFTVIPFNSRASAVTVLPIPWGYPEPQFHSTFFYVTVVLKPNRDGFSLDAMRTQLWLFESAAPVTPARIERVGVCGSAARLSGPSQSSPDPVELHAGLCYLVQLAFPVAPPDPATEFLLQIEGLLLNGEMYAVPKLTFHQREKLEPIAAPIG